MAPVLRFLPLAVAVLGLAGCPLAGGQSICATNADCGDRACARTGECVSATELRSVRLRWTVREVVPTPQTPAVCSPIDALEVAFQDSAGVADGLRYFPVPCDLGTVFYDRLPVWLDALSIVAFDNAGEVLEDARFNVQDAETIIQFDLNP